MAVQVRAFFCRCLFSCLYFSQLADFKDESERKFALQIAENKRLSVQMSSQKKENQRLIERIHILEDRVKCLEVEIGDDL